MINLVCRPPAEVPDQGPISNQQMTNTFISVREFEQWQEEMHSGYYLAKNNGRRRPSCLSKEMAAYRSTAR